MTSGNEAASNWGSDQTLDLSELEGLAASTDFDVGPEAPRSLGEYDLLEEIGAGGMGRVYKARQRNRERLVALKTLHPRYLAKPGLVQRFRKEAESAGRLDHPGIVPVYDFDHVDGQYFFTMPLVDGRGLDQRLRQGPLDNRRAALLVQRVAEAVAYAHRKGVVHRDLKPGNILLARDSGVKVTDFGLARRVDEGDIDALERAGRAIPHPADEISEEATRVGVIMGTPGFLAPEQASAKGNVGPPADIWALGAILYACLTARPPFLGADVRETLALTTGADPVPPDEINPDADPELCTICLKCLRKEPTERYGSADEVAVELARWREGRLAPSASAIWLARASRFLAGAPEVVPLLAGLAVHRLGNVQEGLFAGAAVAGISLAARRGRPGALVLPAVAIVLLLSTIAVSGLLTAQPQWLAGLPAAVTGLAAATVITVCGLTALEPERAGSWWPRRTCTLLLSIGLPALALAVAAALGMDWLREGDGSWAATATYVERYLGRVAGWTLAVPIGLAAGALLGRLNQRLDRFGREPLPAFALGAALMAVAVAWALREAQPDQPTQAARFSAAGAGPALAVADQIIARWVGPSAAPRQTAAAAAFALKLLVLTVPMMLGGLIASLAARLTGRRR